MSEDKQALRDSLLQRISAHQSTSDEIKELASLLGERGVVELVYEIFSSRYDQHMEYTGHYQVVRREIDHLTKYVEGPLLDVSCGTGEILHYLANAINSKGIEVVANDISEPMKKIAEKKLKEKIKKLEFTSWEVRDIPSDGRFRTILCSYSIHGFPTDENGAKSTVLKAMAKALDSGGHLLFLEEYPPRITYSPYLPPAVSLLLPDTETPIEIDLSGGMLECSATLWGFKPVIVTESRIDDKHNLYTLVLRKE